MPGPGLQSWIAYSRVPKSGRTTGQLFSNGEVFDNDGMRFCSLPSNHLFQHIDKIIAAASYPDYKGRGSIRQVLLRPLRQFREVKKIGRFNLIITDFRLCGRPGLKCDNYSHQRE